MNRILIFVNVVLLIAVGVLFFLFFNYKKQDAHTIEATKKVMSNSLKVAYFETDSLQNQYEYFKKVRDELAQKDAQIQKQLSQLRNQYMNKIKEYNQKGPTLSQQEQSEFQQELMKLNSEYQQQEHDFDQDMQAEQLHKLQQVKTRIQNFLKTYCKNKGYSYVFATDEYDNIYYKDTICNITSELVHLLNEEYKANKNTAP
jgi:outer membrane protein